MLDGLTGKEQRVLIALAFCLILGLGVESFHAEGKRNVQIIDLNQAIESSVDSFQQVEIAEFVSVREQLEAQPQQLVAQAGGKIDINTASSEELQELYRVGPKTAEKIILYRDENGPFKKIEDIMNVSGIGEKTFERMKDLITVGGGSAKASTAKKTTSTAKKTTSATTSSGSKKININTASATELTQLKGVGPATAASIVEYRKANGNFKSTSDLVNVKGVGPKTVEGIKDQITISGGSSAKKATTATKSAKPAASAVSSGKSKVNINTASASELTKLSGVGPATASKIVEYREANGPFAKPEDLVNVKGIGPATVQKLLNDITVE